MFSRFIKTAALFLAPLIPGVSFAATPTIANISGTVASGQVLTVSGANMVDEDRTSWDPFFTPSTSGFEGVSLLADGYGTNSWGSAPEGISYDTTIKLQGSQSVKTHLEGEHVLSQNGSAGRPYWFAVEANEPGTTWTDVYFRSYARWHANGWGNHDVKYWWTLNGSTGYFWSFRPDGTNNAPSMFGVYPAGDPADVWHIGAIPGGPIRNDRWYLLEFHARMQGAGAYVLEVWFDNERIINATPAIGITSQGFWEMNTNTYDTPAGWLYDLWQDGLAVSSSRIYPASLIEIGNSSDYATAQKVYQAPEYLSDGSVRITADLTGLGAGPYYLFVTNNRQERSMGYLLGEVDTTAPVAPSGLGVQ